MTRRERWQVVGLVATFSGAILMIGTTVESEMLRFTTGLVTAILGIALVYWRA